MFGRIFKKLIGKSEKKETGGEKLAVTLRQKSGKFSDFLGEKFQAIQNEFYTIRAKCENLRETNYNLGLKHLEKGNLSDAIFRFRFIKKFWPDLLDARYQLAYCLVLKKKPFEAKKILEELFAQNPNYDSKAKELLDDINAALNPTAEQPSPDA
jgi:tetratricopeptide (TPR) repeat protein